MTKIYKINQTVFIGGVTAGAAEQFTMVRSGESFSIGREGFEDFWEIKETHYTAFADQTGTFFTSAAEFENYLTGLFSLSRRDAVRGETPAGAVNSINRVFLTLDDFVPESVEIFVNGLRQKIIDDYQTTGLRTIILTDSPGANEHILVNYLRG